MTNTMADIKKELFQASLKNWLDYEFLTWRWFLKITIILIFLLIIGKLLDRKRGLEIISFGFLISLISTLLDITGTYMVFWEYPYRVLPLEFSEIHDFVVIPVSFMLVYQYCRSWKSFFLVNGLLAAFSSFVMEPVFMLLAFYKPIIWHHIYSFPIFWVLPLICRLIIDRLKSVSRRG